jgi:hypothetical protein
MLKKIAEAVPPQGAVTVPPIEILPFVSSDSILSLFRLVFSIETRKPLFLLLPEPLSLFVGNSVNSKLRDYKGGEGQIHSGLTTNLGFTDVVGMTATTVFTNLGMGYCFS